MEIEKLKEQLVADPEVRELITRRAFEIYLERQGRRIAHPAEDWLRAESEILPRLMREIIERNQRAIESHDEADPVMREAAGHMQHELDLGGAEPGDRATEAATARGELLNQNAASLAAQRDASDEETVPDAKAVLAGAAKKKAGAKRAGAPKAATKPAATKPAAKKAGAKKTAGAKAPAKAAAKKASAAKAGAKQAAGKAPAEKAKKEPARRAAKPAAKKATGPRKPEA